MINNKKGFTLSEVLITLAIIGVVAALTIPSVINNYQNQVYETQYKKGVNTLANGMKKLFAQESVYDLRETSLMACYNLTGSDRANCLNEVSSKIFKINSNSISNQNMLNNLKTAQYKLSYYNQPFVIQNAMAAGSKGKVDPPLVMVGPWTGVSYAFATSDGIVYGYLAANQTNGANTGFYVTMDTNASKSPNAAGKDLYKLLINNKGSIINRTCEYTSSCED